MGFKEGVFDAKLRVLRPHTRAIYDEINRNQSLSVELLNDLQVRRRAEIARFALQHTTFYADTYGAAGVTANDLDDPDTFGRLPIIAKDDIRDRARDIRSDEWSERNSRSVKTSGTTGQPATTYLDERFPHMALSWRMQNWWGVNPWDDAAHVARTGRTGLKASLNELQWWPTRRTYLDAAAVDESAIREFAARCSSLHPPFLEGYVGAMQAMAQVIDRAGIQMPAPRAIGVTAGPLTPSARLQIQEVLGAPVYDQYRCAEVPFLAAECSAQDGLHINADYRFIEVVDEVGRAVPDGEEGTIVVTDLANKVFPIIRYRLGDRVRRREAACSCGVVLPLMDSPGGRTLDLIRLADGMVIAGGLATLFSHRADAVRQFQIHQGADYSIRLIVVEGSAPDSRAVIEGAAQTLRGMTRGQVPVTTEYVPGIAHTRGKPNIVISDVAVPDLT